MKARSTVSSSNRIAGRLPSASLSVKYDLHLTFLIPDYLNYMPVRLIDEAEMENTRDWLSRLLEMIAVRGTLDYRCFLGAPWRIDFPASELAEIPYHVILGDSSVLADPEGRPTRKLIPRDLPPCPHE